MGRQAEEVPQMKQFRSAGRTKSPCYGCENRSSGCHAVCEAYAKYQEKHAEEVEQIREQRAKENAGFRPRMTDKQFQYALKKGKNRVLKQSIK